MKLNAEPFEAIKSGKKDIELRLNDEKRQSIKLSDVITFSKLPDQKDAINAEVVGLLHYSTFADLAEDFTPERLGGADRASIVDGMKKYYSPEDQAKFGVVGIKLRLF